MTRTYLFRPCAGAAAATTLWLCATAARAHDGPRIYVGTSQGDWPHLITLSGPEVAPPPSGVPPFDLYDVDYRFKSPARYAESISAHRYLTEFPGFTPISTSEFGQGDQIGIRFLDALKVWNGSRFVDAGAATFRITGTTPEYESTDFIVPQGPMDAAQDFWRIDNTLPTASHGHLAFYLLGDGRNFVAGSDGIYELTAELRQTPGEVDGPTYTPYAPFSILFQVDRWSADDDTQPTPFPDTDADLDRAFAASGLTAPSTVAIAPEPSGLVFLALGAVSLGHRRRKRRP
jgi:hypothetical protein